MTPETKKLFQSALSLPADMRVRLWRCLEASLDPETVREIDLRWAREANRRMAEGRVRLRGECGQDLRPV